MEIDDRKYLLGQKPLKEHAYPELVHILSCEESLSVPMHRELLAFWQPSYSSSASFWKSRKWHQSLELGICSASTDINRNKPNTRTSKRQDQIITYKSINERNFE